MTRPNAKQPLESFDPRLMKLLISGARGRITIPFLGEGAKAQAHTFQRRLHTLRSRMRHNNHEHSTLVSRATTRLFWGQKAIDQGLVSPHDHYKWSMDEFGKLGAILVIEPVDARFESILASIDYDAAPITSALGVTPPGDLPEPEPMSVEELLENLPEVENKPKPGA